MKRVRMLAGVVLLILWSLPLLAQTPEASAPKLDTGGTAWMLTSAALVLFMTIPGLFLFYGGLVRSKNVLGMLMQNFMMVGIITLQWIIIGRKGAEIDKLKQEVSKRTKREVHIDIVEVHRPELDATLVAESIALQLEKRVAFRRAMRKAVDSALRFGCKGIKVRVAGRLNGAEIARKEWYLQGRLPLQTLRADIDYGTAEAQTTYGVIGVKCWIYQGENIPRRTRREEPKGEAVAVV